MTIAVRASTTADEGYGNYQTPIPVPPGTQNGDFLLLIQQVSKEATSSPPIPGGFTQAGNAAVRVNSGSCGPSVISYRWASSEPAAYSFTGSGGGTMCPFMLALTGVDTNSPFEALPAWTATTSGSTSLPAPSVSIVDDDSLLVCVFGALYGSSAVTWTAPSGMGLTSSDRSGNYNNAAVCTGQFNSGSTGVKTAIVSNISQQGQAGTLALKSLSAAPPVNAGQFLLFF